ncbi:MAG: DUF2235 domain-containing protein [Sulfuricaulis sp.]
MKRIVICADGTWNIRDQIDKKTGKRRPTNVTKLARSVLGQDANEITQLVFYHDGVGTHWGLDRFTGGAFGAGMADNIRDLYRFLVYNYRDGDEIFLFGFSRGAFTVRTLAGFMNKCGFVGKDDDYYVPDIYSCYEKNFDPSSPQWKAAFHNVRHPRPCPEIKFIGVWDTVGALGAPGLLGQLLNRNKFHFHDVALNDHIRNAYHAVSIDEHRAPFVPSLWSIPAGWNGKMEQAWFPGVHCGVGGGYDPDGLANEALHWIVEKAEDCQLAVDAAYLTPYRPCFNSTLFESMTLKYRLLGQHVRTLGAQPQGNEVLHQAAIDRLQMSKLGYTPKNLQAVATSMPKTTTRRVARGTPC